ncbi:hypothetical protein BDR07DRAFT_1388129 [Suillus spraguei]|nr:hypothetical protein BDR07DRAFT_1388129 [Suillus spraguei]
MEGDSPRVKLPAPSTPPMKTSPKPTHKSPTAWTEEDHTMHQSYKPPGARTQEHRAIRQSYKPPAARTEEDYTAHQSYYNYKPPHQRLNESKYNAITTQKPPIYHTSSLNRHSNPYTPPSPRTIELLERSERIRHLERLLSRERDLPIAHRPWRASDEKAFHERGAISPGTSKSLDLVRVMQAMGLDISSKKDTLAALGNGRPSGPPSTITMEDTVVRNDFARVTPRRSVKGWSLETNAPVTQ